jgi:hypothetical protein
VEPLPSNQSTLASQIIESLVKSADDGSSQFVSEQKVHRIITADAVLEALPKSFSEMSESDHRDLVEWVYTKARALLFITLRCDVRGKNIVQSMCCFRHYGYEDSSLPISEDAIIKDDSRLFHPKFWSVFQKHNFAIYQWAHLAPVFAQTQYDYDLPERCILPFIEKDENVKEGAFSWVHKVVIDPDHDRRNASTVGLVATTWHCGS